MGHQQTRSQGGVNMMVRTGNSVEPLGVRGKGIGPVLVDHEISAPPATAIRDSRPLQTPTPRGLVSPDTGHPGQANRENAGTPQALPANVHKRSHIMEGPPLCRVPVEAGRFVPAAGSALKNWSIVNPA
jgi:hypothetical protein